MLRDLVRDNPGIKGALMGSHGFINWADTWEECYADTVRMINQAQEFIDRKLKSGEYDSAEDVVRAGLSALQQQELFGDFRSGELDKLIQEGERSISERGTLDADEALADRRVRRSARRE